MDSNSIVLNGSVITAIAQDGESVRIRFEPAYIERTMTGSTERTRWKQNGELIFEGVIHVEMGQLQLPAVCAGGDVSENVYTYRDMVPVPLESHGRAGCVLKLEGAESPVVIQATAVRLDMVDVPKYIEHIH